ncbi:MAG: hypothetical protein Q9173_002313 [Seirophora scorigena]
MAAILDAPALSIDLWDLLSRIAQILYMSDPPFYPTAEPDPGKPSPIELDSRTTAAVRDAPTLSINSRVLSSRITQIPCMPDVPIHLTAKLAPGERSSTEFGSPTTAAVLDAPAIDLSGPDCGPSNASLESQKGGRGPAEESDRVPGDDKVDDILPARHDLGRTDDGNLVDSQIKETGQDFRARMRQDHTRVRSKQEDLPERRSRPDPRLESVLPSTRSSSESHLRGRQFNPKASCPRPSDKPAPKLEVVRSSSVVTTRSLANHEPDTQTRRRTPNLIDFSPQPSTFHTGTRSPNHSPNQGSRPKTSNEVSAASRCEGSNLIELSKRSSEPRTPTGSQYEGRGRSGTIQDPRLAVDHSAVLMAPLCDWNGSRVRDELLDHQPPSVPSSSIPIGGDSVLPGDSISAVAGWVLTLPDRSTVSEAAQRSGQSRGTTTPQTAPESLPAITSDAIPHSTVDVCSSTGSNEAHPLPYSTSARARFQGQAAEDFRIPLRFITEESGSQTQSHPQSTSAHSSHQMTAATSRGAEHWVLAPEARRFGSAAPLLSIGNITAASPPAVEPGALERKAHRRPPQNTTAADSPAVEPGALKPEAPRRPQSAAPRYSVRRVGRTIPHGSLRSSLESEPEHHSRPQSPGAQSNCGSGSASELGAHPRPPSTAHSATGSDFQSAAGAHPYGPLPSSLESVYGSLSTSPTMFSADSEVATRRNDPSRDIRPVLEEWCDQGYISRKWTDYVEFNGEYNRNQVEVGNQIRSFEDHCRKGIELKLSRFQVYGTPDKFAYDLVKCWVHFRQHIRYGGSTFPPGYTPIYEEVDEVETVNSEFTLY